MGMFWNAKLKAVLGPSNGRDPPTSPLKGSREREESLGGELSTEEHCSIRWSSELRRRRRQVERIYDQQGGWGQTGMRLD